MKPQAAAKKMITKATKPANLKKKPKTKTEAKQEASKAVSRNLGATQTLSGFLDTAGTLTLPEREKIIDQALVLLDEFYVHLPLKRAMHAIEPLQRLKLLKQRHSKLSERAFHDEMISIFVHLRDLHTNYILPDPFRSRTAFVPFRLESYTEKDKRNYIVTQVSPTVKDTKFKAGVRVTHWNNIPIDRAVEINAEREAGSNLDARHARGLSAMTQRWMGMSLPPDEEKVTVRYMDGDKSRDIEFDWIVILPDSPATGVDLLSDTGKVARLLGVDAKTEIERRVLKLLFAPEAMESERRMAKRAASLVRSTAATTAAGDNLAEMSTMPDVFSSFKTVKTSHGKFGYIRIRTFNVNDDQAFVEEFIRIANLVSQNGLILDVRGNGGGLILAGERLLQLLTPKRIDPARLHFINTTGTLKLCEANPDFLGEWIQSISESVETGAQFSQGFPINSADDYNSIGQKYQGPVVLIIDALCYSTTDIFTAGFQDHEIGKILGTDGNTGAGGANVFGHDLLRSLLPGDDSPIQDLPNGVSFRVAIRRTTRVGPRATVPVEDLGIRPDVIHPLTKNDLINSNADLIEEAASILANMGPVVRLTAAAVTAADGALKITAETQNVTRIDLFLNDRPQQSLDVNGGTTTFSLPKPAEQGTVFILRGYRDNQLVVAQRLSASGN
ncbi:MAG: S41 family peptidase [Acidobacteriota bacterium]